MKAPAFDYRAPTSLDEALSALQDAPEDTSFLAGGQSLMPLLALRMARPEVLVDLNGVEELALVERRNGVLRLGAMVRHRRLETDPAIAAAAPLLPLAAHYVAHLPIRTRGTVGGSVAHAEPSAELPTALAALGARVELSRAGGQRRTLPISEFVIGPLMTAIEPGELLTAIEIPVPGPGTGAAFHEVARTHGAFALAGSAAIVRLDGNGAIADASIACCGVGGVPYAPQWVADVVRGHQPGDELFASVAERARGEMEPFADGHAGEDYRRRVAGVLIRRALAAAAARANGGDEGARG